MAENDFWVEASQLPLDLNLLRYIDLDGEPTEEQLRVYTVDALGTNFARPCFAIAERGDADMDDITGVIEETLTRILDNGGTPDDVYRIMGLMFEDELDPDMVEGEDYTPIDRGYCIPGHIESYETVPDEVADIGNILTDKQVVQFEQAVERYELPLHDAMLLTKHEYDGFQARAICKAAKDRSFDAETLEKIADPHFTARQMSTLAAIVNSPVADFDPAPFFDPSMDADRMTAAYRVVMHGGKNIPYKSLNLDQLRVVAHALTSTRTPMDVSTVEKFARPAFSAEQMGVIAAAFRGAHFEPSTGDKSLTSMQVFRILNAGYAPSVQVALLTAMRGQTPVAALSDKDFSSLFPSGISADKVNAIAYGLNEKRLGITTAMHFASIPTLSPLALDVVYDAAAKDRVSGDAVRIMAETPGLTVQNLTELLVEAESGTPASDLKDMADGFAAASAAPEKAESGTCLGSEAREMVKGKDSLSAKSETRDTHETAHEEVE